MASKLQLLALQITKSKNNGIFMVNTPKGSYSIRKETLEKRGINVEPILAGIPYKFPEPTVVIVEVNKAGDLMFPDNNGVATVDSTRVDGAGKKLYSKGDKVYAAGDLKGQPLAYTTEFPIVRSFVSYELWKIEQEMAKLQLA